MQGCRETVNCCRWAAQLLCITNRPQASASDECKGACYASSIWHKTHATFQDMWVGRQCKCPWAGTVQFICDRLRTCDMHYGRSLLQQLAASVLLSLGHEAQCCVLPGPELHIGPASLLHMQQVKQNGQPVQDSVTFTALPAYSTGAARPPGKLQTALPCSSTTDLFLCHPFPCRQRNHACALGCACSTGAEDSSALQQQHHFLKSATPVLANSTDLTAQQEALAALKIGLLAPMSAT